jgi:hypothetical protein
MLNHKYGKCEDTNCEEPNEPCNLIKYNNKWICDGCYEAALDNEEFMDANRQDMIELGVY